MYSLFILIILIILILVCLNYIKFNENLDFYNNTILEKFKNIQPSKILFIENNVYYHYEIIESLILKYKNLFKINNNVKIYLSIKPNKSFIEYIKNKYPYIILNKNPKIYDYYINCTIYDKNYNSIKQNKNYIYISHEVTKRLEKYNNVYFLTPLGKNYIYCDILPFMNKKKKTDIPIYIIQGGVNRRNYNLLLKILETNYKYDYKIKIVSKQMPPKYLLKYKEKLIIKTNLNFIDYHKEFTNVYCILPLITKNKNVSYYKNKLTSSINYAKAYNLKTIIDNDLQLIYNLNNVEIFNNENDISKSFKKTLVDYYN